MPRALALDEPPDRESLGGAAHACRELAERLLADHGILVDAEHVLERLRAGAHLGDGVVARPGCTLRRIPDALGALTELVEERVLRRLADRLDLLA